MIGVLGLQGDFVKHQQMLDRIGVNSIPVRYPEELKTCEGLIIPGGESTTLTKQIDFARLRAPLLEFAAHKPIFGTCAGLIMLAKDVEDPRVDPLGLLDISVNRNGWGRQVHSAAEEIGISALGDAPYRAIFIRAPEINDVRNPVRVLATYEDQPVMVTNGLHLATAFHPELGDDTRIHEYFKKLTHA